MMDSTLSASSSSIAGDAAKDLGAPLLPSSGRASFRPTVKRRRMVFDMMFGMLFGIFAFVIVALAFSVGIRAVSNRRTPGLVTMDDADGTLTPTGQAVKNFEGVKALVGVVILSLAGVLMSTAWVQVMIYCAPALIGYTLLAITLFGMVGGVTFFVGGNTAGGVVTLLLTLFGLSYFRVLKRRVHFASANIKVACQAIRDNPPVLGLGFLLLLLQVAWSLIWALAVLGAATNAKSTTLTSPTSGKMYNLGQCTTYQMTGPSLDFSASCVSEKTCLKCMCSGDLVYDGRACFAYKLYGWPLFVLLLGFLWGCTVLRNVGHCAISGTVGTWWISGANRSSAALWSNLRRALTSAFGSICLASLLVALIRTVRAVLFGMQRSTARHNNSPANAISALLECMLAVVDRALSLFNKYALVYVALYGLDFTSAGAAVTELFKARGIDVLVNDTLIDTVLGLGSVIVGLVCALIGYFYGIDAGLSRATVGMLSVSGAFIGAGLGFIVASVMESAVSTVFVCFAEDPKALEISHPDLADDLVEAWETMLQGPISQLGVSGQGRDTAEWQGLGDIDSFKPPSPDKVLKSSMTDDDPFAPSASEGVDSFVLDAPMEEGKVPEDQT